MLHPDPYEIDVALDEHGKNEIAPGHAAATALVTEGDEQRNQTTTKGTTDE